MSNQSFEKAERILSERRQKAESFIETRKKEFESNEEYVSICNKIAETQREFFSIMTDRSLNKDTRSEAVTALSEKRRMLEFALSCFLKREKGDENYLTPQYHCSTCSDKGYINGHICDCLSKLAKQFAVEELREQCGNIELRKWEDYDITLYPAEIQPQMLRIKDYCFNYASTFSAKSPSILFVGKTGLGKTFLSSCIASTVIAMGHTVAFGSISSLIREMEDEHFGRSEKPQRTYNLLVDSDLLILDDLGAEFKTSFTESVIYDLLNSRINQKRPMIVSTNFSRTELSSFYNDRILSRLSGFATIVMQGKDLRSIIMKRKFL